MIEVTEENYFEIAEAIHCWLSLNHEGQFSDTYKLLCKSQFEPGHMWSESRVEKENPYYNEINKENVAELMDNIEYFLD